MNNKTTKLTKKILAFLIAIVIAVVSVPFTAIADTDIPINGYIFTDENFKIYISRYIDTNKDGSLSTAECESVKTLLLSNKGISNLNGIEYFTNLETLDCRSNDITSLNLGNNTKLKKLYCSENELTGLNVTSNTELTVLRCSDNKISWINLSGITKLEELDCANNGIGSLDLTKNVSLRKLYCQNNTLEWNFDLSKNVNLEQLYCYNNNLRKLDLSNNTNLVALDCRYNQLTSLDLSNNPKVKILDCNGNTFNIGSIDEGYSLYSISYTGFDDTKTSNWIGADYHENGAYIDNFVAVDGKRQFKYTYDLGNGKTAVFTLTYYNSNVVEYEVPDETLIGYSISLNGYIDVNFYMELGDELAQSETAYMHFTTPTDDIIDIPVKDAKIYTTKKHKYYVFSCPIVAKEMTGEVNGQIIDGDMVGEKYTYTVKNYAECILENATPLFDYTKAGHITKSLLNYGAYSQMYFNHEESNLANDTELMTEEEKDVSSVTATTLEKYKYVKTGQSSYIKYGGSSLYLLSATTLRLYFLPSNGVNIDDVTFTCEGETLEADKSGSYYYVDIDGISAEDLDKTYTINVSCKGESFDINYSVLTYCYNVLKKTATDEDTMELKNTMAALYLYNQSAEKYFSSTSDEITETYGE